jgi:hypothetical protein
VIGTFRTQSASNTGLLVRTADGHNMTLCEELYFDRPEDVANETITVPIGAQTDGASIPREAWGLMPPFGPYWMAAVLHDYLYHCTRRTRFECDLILWEAMLALGVPELTARTIYNAVNEFGQHAFDDDRAAQGPRP